MTCCRQTPATKLTDIVADSGRPVRLRFDGSAGPGSQAREQELPVTIEVKQVLWKLNAVRYSGGSGELCQQSLLHRSRVIPANRAMLSW